MLIYELLSFRTDSKCAIVQALTYTPANITSTLDNSHPNHLITRNFSVFADFNSLKFKLKENEVVYLLKKIEKLWKRVQFILKCHELICRENFA